MNTRRNPFVRNEKLQRKMAASLPYLLAFDCLFFAFLLGGYVYGARNLSTLVGVLAQIFLVSSMLLGDMARLSQDNIKAKKGARWVLLACAFLLLFCQFRI